VQNYNGDIDKTWFNRSTDWFVKLSVDGWTKHQSVVARIGRLHQRSLAHT